MSLRSTAGEPIFPNWVKLLELAAEALSADGKTEEGAVVAGLVRMGHLQQAADIAESEMKGPAWDDFLRGIFDITPESIDEESMALPRALWGISNRLITLNFDKVLRYSCPTKSIIEFTNSNSSIMSNFCRAKDSKFYAWHLHGQIDDTSSIILRSDKYEEFYGKDQHFKAAIASLTNVLITHSLLFVGCSLTDAELLAKITDIADIFKGSAGPHYALVHKNEVALVRAKLGNIPIKIIPFPDFGAPLVQLINQLGSTKHDSVTAVIKSPSNASPALPSIIEKVKVAVLMCDAVDLRFSDDDLLKEIRKLKLEIFHLALNIENLNNLDSYDYVFILTSTSRGRLIIEDEGLSSQKIDIDELLENIAPAPYKGVFIFTNSLDLNEAALHRATSTPYPVAIYPNLTKGQCATIGFKFFKKSEINFCSKFILFNEEKFKFLKLGATTNEYKRRSPISELIDHKTLRNFIGRVDDLRQLCRRIISHRANGDVLTVKGAGGIGKTSIVKLAAIEFASRGVFEKGIAFVDCEFITDYSVFEQEIARLFNLQQAHDFRGLLKEHYSREDRLLILDNAESVLTLADESRIRDLISFISDYCLILVTSREPLRLENEVVFDLRRLTTDEAYDLFVFELGLSKIIEKDRDFIRERIIEELLDNNPLAIKLVTRNTPRNKDIRVLKLELEEDVFAKVQDEDISVFDKVADRNVERKRSIFASINYSYKGLNDKEKIAFELLSLFPDGINMENFKRVSALSSNAKIRDDIEKNNPVNKFIITDAIIRSLHSKSVIEIDNKNVYLQSLLARFAEFQFNSRSPEEIKRFKRNAFQYNSAFASALTDLDAENAAVVHRVFWRNQKNFIKAAEFSGSIGENSDAICDYIDDLTSLAIPTCSFSPLLSSIARADFDFEHGSVHHKAIRVLSLALEYFAGDFRKSMRSLEKEFPLAELGEYDPSAQLNRLIASVALNLYGMDGQVIGAGKIASKFVSGFNGYPDLLFVAGEFDPAIIDKAALAFFTFEAALAVNRLNISVLDNYIRTLYKEQHIERIQANYVRVKLSGMPLDDLADLVVVNPYTTGIKCLIEAIASTTADDPTIRDLFSEAIANLFHIKYYHVEAHYYFAKYLHSIGDEEEFEKIRAQGIQLTQKHSYRYLEHLFKQLATASPTEYNPVDYPLPEDAAEGLRGIILKQYAKFGISQPPKLEA